MITEIKPYVHNSYSQQSIVDKLKLVIDACYPHGLSEEEKLIALGELLYQIYGVGFTTILKKLKMNP